MPIRRFRCRVTSTQAGERLDLLVHSWLEAALARQLSNSTIRRLIVAGAIRADGRPTTRPAWRLDEGARLEAVIDEAALPPAAGGAVPAALQVLFEDETLIAVNKPAGLQVHASADPSRPDLFTLVRQHLSEKMATPPSTPRGDLPYLALHHRLDRETSGIVLFVKRSDANAGVAAQFEGHRIRKEYHALTPRPARTRASWTVENSLGSIGTGRRARMGRVAEGGQRALTRFSVLQELVSALLLEARPETGRKHQIRAHLAESGMPILGDARYGGPVRIGSLDIPRVMLHAARLALQHPLTGERLQIAAQYPQDFKSVLAALGAAGQST